MVEERKAQSEGSGIMEAWNKGILGGDAKADMMCLALRREEKQHIPRNARGAVLRSIGISRSGEDKEISPRPPCLRGEQRLSVPKVFLAPWRLRARTGFRSSRFCSR